MNESKSYLTEPTIKWTSPGEADTELQRRLASYDMLVSMSETANVPSEKTSLAAFSINPSVSEGGPRNRAERRAARKHR